MKFGKKIYLCDDAGSNFFGPGSLRLLERVLDMGSLKKAADSMELSYHKALHMVKAAEEVTGQALLTRKVGGKNGGGSTLTPAALKLMEKYRAFTAALDDSAQALFPQFFGEEN